MITYCDTSFLVSLYVFDTNSALAAALMKKVQLPVLLTALGELELTNAISLRVFRKELLSYTARAARSLIRKDIEEGVLVLRPLSAAIYERAKQISRRQTPRLGTRTLDVLHVASAAVLQADKFYTFDGRQRKLARAEGLTVA